MAVPKRKKSRANTHARRSQWKAEAPTLVKTVENGKVTNSHRAALGIRGSTVIGSDGQPSGVGVAGVERGGGAEKAGIRPGDVITSINGKETPTMAALAETITTLKPGARVKVGLIRADGTEETVTVTLGELQAD